MNGVAEGTVVGEVVGKVEDGVGVVVMLGILRIIEAVVTFDEISPAGKVISREGKRPICQLISSMNHLKGDSKPALKYQST